MLTKLGYKPGTSLGATGSSGTTQPIRLIKKEDKGGIGHDTDRKRKLKEATESLAKKVKEDEEDYRERVRREHDEKRREGQIFAAQKIVEKFDTRAHEVENDATLRPLNTINILWRGIARERMLREQDRRMRHDLLQSSSTLPDYVDPEEDNDDHKALGKVENIAEEEVEEEDLELDEFNALPSEDRLEQLVRYLRSKYHYCFWCKYEYPDADMDGCPGFTEDNHD
jgi:uncharacterized protein DUF4187/G-patch protein